MVHQVRRSIEMLHRRHQSMYAFFSKAECVEIWDVGWNSFQAGKRRLFLGREMEDASDAAVFAECFPAQ